MDSQELRTKYDLLLKEHSDLVNQNTITETKYNLLLKEHSDLVNQNAMTELNFETWVEDELSIKRGLIAALNKIGLAKPKYDARIFGRNNIALLIPRKDFEEYIDMLVDLDLPQPPQPQQETTMDNKPEDENKDNTVTLPTSEKTGFRPGDIVTHIENQNNYEVENVDPNCHGEGIDRVYVKLIIEDPDGGECIFGMVTAYPSNELEYNIEVNSAPDFVAPVQA